MIDKLKTMGPISRSELAGTLDFSKNAFPNDPVMSKLQVFSTQFLVSRIVDGKPVVQTGVPPTIGVRFTPTGS